MKAKFRIMVPRALSFRTNKPRQRETSRHRLYGTLPGARASLPEPPLM